MLQIPRSSCGIFTSKKKGQDSVQEKKAKVKDGESKGRLSVLRYVQFSDRDTLQ